MQALSFWKAVTVDREGLLEQFLRLLESNGASYCLIGGQAVNAYAEPVVSLDLDVVIATEQVDAIERLLAERFVVKRFSHSINVSAPGSDLRVQIQTDPRYLEFLAGAVEKDVLGLKFRVARLEDVFQGKIWAAMDETRRPSKRQKDLADIARLIEINPDLTGRIPPEILEKLV